MHEMLYRHILAPNKAPRRSIHHLAILAGHSSDTNLDCWYAQALKTPVPVVHPEVLTPRVESL